MITWGENMIIRRGEDETAEDSNRRTIKEKGRKNRREERKARKLAESRTQHSKEKGNIMRMKSRKRDTRRNAG
jgi:hypothetical protein